MLLIKTPDRQATVRHNRVEIINESELGILRCSVGVLKSGPICGNNAGTLAREGEAPAEPLL